MNALVFHVLTVLVSAGGPAEPQNALLTELVEKGVQMPDGQCVRLPPPTMAEGLSAAQQAAVLAKVAPKGNVEAFMDPGATPLPRLQKIVSKTPPAPGKEPDLIRTVDLHFVIYGDWNVLTSKAFSQTILKEGKANNNKNGGMVKRAGYMSPAELAVRGLPNRAKAANIEEYFLYTTLELFDQVEVSATRFGVATKTPTGVIVAARLDPRFAKDKEFPNQWREITRNAAAVATLGPPQPYSGAAFYAKVTRLIVPNNAIFVEFHQVFYEPEAWFGANNRLMPTELRKMIPFEVKVFRTKLATAMERNAEKKPGEGEK
jgi:hypothetical protein